MALRYQHEESLQELYDEMKPVLESSEQAIYIYLDDIHKVCNEKFASMLGYESPEEWASIETSFPETFVADESQETLVSTYRDATRRFVGSTVDITWKTVNGEPVNTTVILVPISYDWRVYALHFVTIKE